jgi:hypothetical protein
METSSESQLKATAYHEAGHAVARLYFGWPVVRAMIVESEGYHGAVEGPNIHIELAEHFAEGTEQALRNFMVISFVGIEAQRLHNPASVEAGQEKKDEERVLDALWGMGYSPERLEAILAERRVAAKEFVPAHWGKIDRVAKALLVKREMTGEELRQVLKVQGNR